MNAGGAMATPIHGVIDRDGRLVEADARFAELNARAGGDLGAPIAIPQVATLARLAQRLGILVSRGVIAADGEEDIDLWVRAQPDGEGVRIALTGWRPRPAWNPPADAAREGDFIRSGADWLWETDAALRLTFLSAGAGARHGFDPSAMLGQPLTRLFALAEQRGGDLPILDALASRRHFDDQPAAIRLTGREVRLSAIPRTDVAGAFSGFVGAVHMIGEKRQPLAPVAPVPVVPDMFSTRLDRALRGPLGRIIANADSMNAEAEGPLRRDYVDYAADIAAAGRHLLGLVDDLVDLQAIERPDFTVAVEQIDLTDLARRAAGLLAVRASEAHVTIKRPESADDLPATGEFRRSLQILVNLIGNAVRYSPEGSMVVVEAARDGDRATVTVTDQGKGIADDDQVRIFEKFERVDTTEAGGSGLGLYIARRLARAMGGDVTVASAPGQGASFTLSLPYRG